MCSDERAGWLGSRDLGKLACEPQTYFQSSLLGETKAEKTGSSRRLSVSGLEILPYEHFIPVTGMNGGMNGGMNSGGPEGIILDCLLYFLHHKHSI